MAKTQMCIRVDDEIAEAARCAAVTRGISVSEYVAGLIRVDGVRLRKIEQWFVEREAAVRDCSVGM
ncbi:hypothetical protein ABCR94_00875 [Streptomyces sp. 21So2-11]|uniref:hypothetical protein n=1 Tax=Streptomyces sp. 21So2-11 TaxID=3144408 RepID=UPI00321AC7CA